MFKNLLVQVLSVLLVVGYQIYTQQIDRVDSQLYSIQSTRYYRNMIKQHNKDYINKHNSQVDKSFQLYPYETFIYYDRNQIRQLYMNKYDTIHTGFGVTLQISLTPQEQQEKQKFQKYNKKLLVNHTNHTGPVKNQGKCGSCYAFSALSTLYNSQLLCKNQNIVPLSEQQIVDCSKRGQIKRPDQQNFGCDGGWPHLVFAYVQINGLASQRDYPYLRSTYVNGTVGICKNGITRTFYNEVTNIVAAMKVDYQRIFNIVEKRVISIGIPSNFQDFLYYKSGILTTCKQKKIDHAMNLVGYKYSEVSGEYFWIIKNSWGLNWGQYGYVRISMFTGCPINAYMSYPVLDCNTK